MPLHDLIAFLTPGAHVLGWVVLAVLIVIGACFVLYFSWTTILAVRMTKRIWNAEREVVRKHNNPFKVFWFCLSRGGEMAVDIFSDDGRRHVTVYGAFYHRDWNEE